MTQETTGDTSDLPQPVSLDNLETGECVFCRRIMRDGTTEHHLIPRRCHRNQWFQKRYTRKEMQQTVPTCRQCHRAIHRFEPKEKRWAGILIPSND